MAMRSTVRQVAAANPVKRRSRRPEHTWQVKQKPFLLQPFCIAPVLPGETLKNAVFQARVVSDPLANPLIGWWQEYYWFYVKHRDMEDRELFENMMLDQGTDLSSLYEASSVAFHHKGSRLNWTKKCYERIIECYFRDDEEAWDVAGGTMDGLAIAKIVREGWWNSIIDSTLMPSENIVDEGGAAVHTSLELEVAERRARFDAMMSMSNLSYEDYLRLAGIRVTKEEQHVPELLRYTRNWTYPTNTIDPNDGSATSAVSWAVSERIDKDRFFREPGFIIGITCSRPKTYYKEAVGSAAHQLDDAFGWMPALLRDDPRTSLKLEDNAIGAWEGATNDYYWDTRDLFLYGDQFIGGVYDPDSTTGINTVALPGADLKHRYVTDADVDSMFVTADTACFIRQDGVVRFDILTPEGIDWTPKTVESGNLNP